MMATLTTVRKAEVTNDDNPSAVLITECHEEFGTNGWAALLSLTGTRNFTTSNWLTPDREQLDRQRRGTKTYLDLPPGIYDCESVWKPYKTHRVFFEVRADGSIEIIPEHEARERLLDTLRE
jgi:hypothetical protein